MGGGILLIATIALSYTNKSVPFFHFGARETFAALFFVIGHAYKVSASRYHKKGYCLLVGLILITMGTSVVKTNMLDFQSWQVLPYTLIAISGILATFYLAQQTEKSKNRAKHFLIYIGNHTLTILTWHFLSFKLVSLMIILTYHLPIARLAEFPVLTEYSVKGWFVLYFAVGVLIPLGFSKIKFLK